MALSIRSKDHRRRSFDQHRRAKAARHLGAYIEPVVEHVFDVDFRQPPEFGDMWGDEGGSFLQQAPERGDVAVEDVQRVRVEQNRKPGIGKNVLDQPSRLL